MRTLLALLTVCGLAGGTAAEPIDTGPVSASARWTADYEMQQRWLGDASATSLASGLLGGRLSFGRRILVMPGPRGGLDLAGFVRFGAATGDAKLFQELDTSMRQFQFTAGARLDSRVVWRLHANAQLDVGAARTDISIGQDGAMTAIADHGWGVIATGTIGLELDVLRGRTRYLALAADLGYVVTSPITIRAYPRDRPDEDLAIPTTYWSLGELDTRGVTFAAGLRGGF